MIPSDTLHPTHDKCEHCSIHDKSSGLINVKGKRRLQLCALFCVPETVVHDSEAYVQ